MKSADKQLRKSAQSWMSRVERKPPLNVDYSSEPNDWLQHIILEAEEKKNSEKKDQLSLLKVLNSV